LIDTQTFKPDQPPPSPIKQDAEKCEEKEGEGGRFFGNDLLSIKSLTSHGHGQRAKLKLGKGKAAATNAVDTSFKARCKQ